jgi:hypothetical protein
LVLCLIVVCFGKKFVRIEKTIEVLMCQRMLMFRRTQAIKNPTRRNTWVGKAVKLRRKIRKLPYGIVLTNKAPAERKFAGVEVCDASFDDHLFVSGAWRGRNYLI